MKVTGRYGRFPHGHFLVITEQAAIVSLMLSSRYTNEMALFSISCGLYLNCQPAAHISQGFCHTHTPSVRIQ